MSESWLWMTAGDLGRGIEAGAIDARALTDVYLAAIDAHPDAARIYARVTPERARAEAAVSAARARAGVRRGPLDGVPISWKDLFDTADIATEAGSALLKGRVPDRDAAVLGAARRAGLACLGKTHMTELAFSGLGINPVTATPPNINDPELAPGGSSSGAAASVAFGLAAAGIGSDTGGSVRTPSAWNDLVGLRTSPGLLSLEGVVPLCPSFDTVGPLVRSVEDAALLLGAMSGAKPVDLDGSELQGLRLLALDTSGLGPTQDEPAAAFASAVERLSAGGAQVEVGGAPGWEASFGLAGVVFAGEAYATWGAAIEAAPDLMFAPVRERFRGGAAPSAVDFVRAWTELRRLRRLYLAGTAGYDAVLAPSVASLPPNVERLLADHRRFNEANLLALRNTRIANLMGLAALTLPTGAPSCGIMAMVPPGQDARLLRIGAAMERRLA